jgi:hypothetical protein
MKSTIIAIFSILLTFSYGAQAQSWKNIVLKSANFAADDKCEIVSSALAQTNEGIIYSSYWHCKFESAQWGHDYRCFDYIDTPDRDSKCEGVFKK